ncbi:MAG: phosphatidate cytidylyltransferase [Bauldia sp.]|nr:phosphatidate cytidylyltransferase [Bauldia sp.]
MTDASAAGGSGAELRQRIVWGVGLAVVALAVAVAGGWITVVAAAVLTFIVGWEWTRMTVPRAPSALAPALGVPAFAAAAVIVAGFEAHVAAVIVAGLGAVLMGAALRSAWAAGGVVYAAALGIALVALRLDPVDGLVAVLFLFAVVWGADTGAYTVGRTLGGPKLWPRVSPKKTWSGFLGGLAVGIAAGLLVIAIAGRPVTLTLGVVALALALVSVAGDLFESAVKRRFGVKDSSHIIPGHGGVMDRVDALLFAAAAAAAIGWAHGGQDAVGQGLLRW